MRDLSTKLTLDKETINSKNLCDKFSADDLTTIGEEVWVGYSHDKHSRSKWEKRMQAAMDLAMQVTKDKTFPWANCSNIAFPLVTIATLQFHSRAYPAIISGTEIVKFRVVSDDPTGQEAARAYRISSYMSWQCLEEDQAWEEQKDRLLINLPIVGTTFTKSYFDHEKGHKVDETVLAQDLVLNYWAKSVDSCPRKTHIIPFFKNDLHSRFKRGVFRDAANEGWYGNPATASSATQARDNRVGQTPPQPDDQTPYIGLEQHVHLDLDGDGYAEPYIITIEETSKFVLRIVTGFDQEEDIEKTVDGAIIAIRAMQYFTKYSFIPSPDGGIYDVGFGVLLGPLNESVNSLINQLVDAGTMSVTAGGFLGRGAKIRGGIYSFSPFEWKRVDSTADDLNKSIYPLPVRDPNAVLLQLLQLLINYVERIAGTTDPMVGESTGQNTPAETSRSMIAEGMKIYSAVYKRIWRSMKEEFKKDFIINTIYMPTRKAFGPGKRVLRDDFMANPENVVPAADPHVTSDAMATQQAILLKQSAASTPGYDKDEVERRFLRAIRIPDLDKVFLGVAKTGAPEDPKVQIAKLKVEAEMHWLDSEQTRFVMEMQEEQRMNSAEIAKIAAEIQNMQDTTQGDHADRQIAVMNGVLSLMKAKNESLLSKMEVIKSALEVRRAKYDSDARDNERLAAASGNGGSAAGTRSSARAAA